MAPSTAANYWSGKRAWPIDVLPALQRVLGMSADEMLNGRKPGAVRDDAIGYRGAPTADDEVELDSIDLAYGMGGTFLDVGEAEVERVKFSRKWLRKFTDAPPEKLGVAEGVGDSMEPTIYDRDLVIFDRSARLEDHLSDKIWVFAFGQVGMIKRLRPMPDGSVKIMSDNQSVRDEIATDSDLHIIGRVVASMRRH